MKIAFFSPLPPQGSGIADYSAELLPYLAAAGAELTLFVDEGLTPQLPPACRTMPVLSVRRFESWRRDNPDALLLYHVGNSADYHTHIIDTLRRHPGVVVLHDLILFHLFAGMTLHRGDPAGFRDLMRATYGPDGLRAADEYIAGRPYDFDYTLVEPVLDACQGVIAHNSYVVQQVHQLRPALPVTRVNMHCAPLPAGEQADRATLRAELGLEARLVLASFGWVTPNKRVDVALRAFARLRVDCPQALFLLVGQPAPEYDLSALISSLGLADAVRITGRRALSEFVRYMQATDIALNLRYPTAGETSASLIRLLGLGVPTLVSNVGGFVDFPASCCARVDVDGLEEETVLAILRRLVGDEAFRRQMGENARAYIARAHDPTRTAQDTLRFIGSVAAHSAGRLPAPVTGLIDHLGELLAGLGLEDRDDAALAPLAAAMAELGLAEEAA